MVVKTPSNSHVLVPPPIDHEKYSGIKASRKNRATFEKDSLPAASAGNGPFLIAGYWGEDVLSTPYVQNV